MNLTSIPLLPQSIAVGLQDDLIQYTIELKFLLLFFEKPLAVLSNSGFNFISEESVESVRQGKKPKISSFDEINLQHLNLLASEEWQELMSYCDPLYSETDLIITDSLPTSGEEAELINEVDKIFAHSSLGEFSTYELWDLFRGKKTKLDDETYWDLVGAYITRMEMLRLLDILNICRKRRIPMVWGVDTDLAIVETYADYLIGKKEYQSEDKQIRATMRLLRGKELLNEIFHLEVVNLATVPVSKIVDFRQSNADLLQSFLTKYRGFLVDLQNEPSKTDKVVQSHAQEIIEDMDTIRKELLLLRNARKYKWLQHISSAAYDGASAGVLASIWSLLFNPIISAGVVGTVLTKAAAKLTGDFAGEEEQEDAILFRASSGYLWKAHEKFEG